MKIQNFRRYVSVFVLALGISAGVVGTATADQSQSTHYMVNETQFGSGSNLSQCSDQYCAKTSAGDTTVGSASSDNYSAEFGFNTSDVPLLEVGVVLNDQDMGVLDTDKTGTATATVTVRDYLSNGYVLELAGSPPAQSGHTITALGTPTTSHQGAEQFGVNLADNTSPDIGLAPVQVPSGSFSFGTAASDYSTPDLFKFASGDVIASSSSSSGETQYTISMIMNISNTTPGGRYTSDISAVAVPVY